MIACGFDLSMMYTQSKFHSNNFWFGFGQGLLLDSVIHWFLCCFLHPFCWKKYSKTSL